jgi:hypothetical protein
VQRVRGGRASVAESNQEAGARAGRRRRGVHGTWAGELTDLHYTSLGLRRWAGRALLAALATGALAILSRPDVQVKLFSVHGFKKKKSSSVFTEFTLSIC